MFKIGDKVKVRNDYMSVEGRNNAEPKWVDEFVKDIGKGKLGPFVVTGVFERDSGGCISLQGSSLRLNIRAFVKYYEDWLDELPLGE